MGILSSRCLAAIGGSLFAFALLPRPAAAQMFADFQTNMGGFSVELFHEDVPRTVANFISLAEGTRPWLDPRTQQVKIGVPYYDGIIFHRVIPNFMIQGGSPQGTGTDGPGYKFPNELTKTPEGQLKHTHNAAGMMSMAHSGAKTHTNGSQFFITTSVTAPATFPTHLDDVHTVFGKVTDGPGGTAVQGQAVVDAIAAVPRGVGDKPLTPVVMQSVKIRRVGASAEAFNAQAWSLPDVSEPRRILSAVYNPGASPPASARFELRYERLQHQASVFNYSFDVATWQLLQVGGAQATSIAAADGTEPLNISGLQNLPELFVRGHSIDYTDLIAKTKPPLSEVAEVRLRFTTPAGTEITVTRTGATTGTWSVPGPPAATGGISPCTYGFGSGDPGFFSPLLDLAFPVDRLPWTGGVTLASLRVMMTFDAGSATTGYFTASDVNAAPPAPDIGKGVFTVIVP
jgi:cyclophilin family peptidyl-prolyl cis-trans isomerase